MGAVAIGYAVCAILLYILSPAQRVTRQPFRLDFRGATRGELPNGVRFSPIEIISTPVLLRVYQANDLGRFTSFGSFSRSVFVLESNAAYEKLVNEYQARLSDPRLSPTDRDRLQKEFETKRESISKNDFAISYASVAGDQIPPTLVRKVLIDILTTWANFAINEQHALDYRVAVLSPSILDRRDVSDLPDPVINIQILRAKIYRVIGNIEEISVLPAAELARSKDRMSLAEIRMRLEDIIRFRLEPLVGVARASGLLRNPALTIHFVETQLAYDQRRMQVAQTHANGLREALLIYSNDTTRDIAGMQPRSGATGAQPKGEGETVMPQLSDTFLDRIMSLSQQASDGEYRKKLVEDYRHAVDEIVPLEQAVAYQQQLLADLRGTVPTGPAADEKAVLAEITASTDEVRTLIAKINEIYQSLSSNLNPSTQLFSVTGPPSSRIERKRTLGRLALYGIVVLLATLPVVILLCLVHNRMREEEQAERMIAAAAEDPV